MKEYKYDAQRVCGNGSFSIVFQAIVRQTNQEVAIKKLFHDIKYKNRELDIMRELFHPNVITLKHAFYQEGRNPKEVYLNIVMEYIQETVARIVKHYQ